MYSKSNPKVTDEQILKVLELYEKGESIAKCVVMLNISRGTFISYIGNWSRMECYLKHIEKYPNGRVKNYKSIRPFNRG